MNPLQSYLDGIIIRSEMMENMLYQYICFQNMHQSCTWIRYIHTVGSLKTFTSKEYYSPGIQHFDELIDDYFLQDVGFSKEYEEIRADSCLEEYTAQDSQHPDNMELNRYPNIVACKYTQNSSYTPIQSFHY